MRIQIRILPFNLMRIHADPDPSTTLVAALNSQSEHHLKVLIPELGPVDWLAAGAIVIGEVSALAHELRDHAVKARALQSQFINHNSSVTIHQSQFISHNSSVTIQKSQFINHKAVTSRTNSAVLWIRKYFFRIRITDTDRSASYLDILRPLIKVCCHNNKISQNRKPAGLQRRCTYLVTISLLASAKSPEIFRRLGNNVAPKIVKSGRVDKAHLCLTCL